MGHSSVGIPGRAEVQAVQILESCSFTWIFDTATHRFRRVPRDATVSLELPAPWASYRRLDIDDDRSCFTLELDDGARIRAWLHAEPCSRCGRSGPPAGEPWHGPWWKEPATAAGASDG